MNKQNETIRRLLAKKRYDFNDLTEITALLRGEGGCPWDIEQTHQSIRRCMIEEAYEVVEAIDNNDPILMREELGDVLFQVVFHSQIEREAGNFTSDDVIHDICVKMIRRHPHVFSDAEVHNGEEALSQWEAVKTEEKKRRTLSSRLRAIPPMLPALIRAQKVSEKLGKENAVPDADKLNALTADFSKHPSRETLGALLTELAILATQNGIDAEESLSLATEKVIQKAEIDEKNEKN